MLPKAKPARFSRRLLKRFMYSQMALRSAFLILIGREQPSLRFKVLAEPCSIYFNFLLKPGMRQEFEEYINLAPGLSLAPMKCLTGEAPEVLLTLNIYQVSGIVQGTRAEWSTYITDEQGVSRYMVLEANSDSRSLDPVNLFTKADQLEHRMNGGMLSSLATSTISGEFTSKVRLDDSQPVANIDPGWIAANDFIYWRNGICDRTWYDASLFNASVRSIPAQDIRIEDNTHWARFIRPKPRHVLKYDGGMEFMISPWDNI
jgi:hypothetical protein